MTDGSNFDKHLLKEFKVLSVFRTNASPLPSVCMSGCVQPQEALSLVKRIRPMTCQEKPGQVSLLNPPRANLLPKLACRHLARLIKTAKFEFKYLKVSNISAFEMIWGIDVSSKL